MLTDVPLDMPVEELTTDAAERPSFEDRQIVRLRPLLVARPKQRMHPERKDFLSLPKSTNGIFRRYCGIQYKHLRASVLGVSDGMDIAELRQSPLNAVSLMRKFVAHRQSIQLLVAA